MWFDFYHLRVFADSKRVLRSEDGEMRHSHTFGVGYVNDTSDLVFFVVQQHVEQDSVQSENVIADGGGHRIGDAGPVENNLAAHAVAFGQKDDVTGEDIQVC